MVSLHRLLLQGRGACSLPLVSLALLCLVVLPALVLPALVLPVLVLPALVFPSLAVLFVPPVLTNVYLKLCALLLSILKLNYGHTLWRPS